MLVMLEINHSIVTVFVWQVAITAKVSATIDTPVLNRVDVNEAFVNAKKEVTNGAPPYVKSLMSNSKVALVYVPLLFIGWYSWVLSKILLCCVV